MALAFAVGVTTHSTANADPYVSAAFTPNAGDWLFVAVTCSGSGLVGSLSSSNGLTFDELVRVGDYSNGQANGPRFLLMFAARTMANNVSQTVTFTHGGTPTGTSIAVELVRTFTGAVRRVRQIGSAIGAASTTPTVVMPAAILTGNGCFAALGCGANPGGVTKPTGWTQIQDGGYGTPLVGIETAFRASGETLTTLPYGSSSGTAWGMIAVEIMETGIASPMYYRQNSLQDEGPN